MVTHVYNVFARIIGSPMLVSSHLDETKALEVAQKIADGIGATIEVELGGYRSIYARVIDKIAHSDYDVAVEKVEVDSEYLVPDAIDHILLTVKQYGGNEPVKKKGIVW